MTTPSPESLNQLPANQRRYVGTSEISALKEKGLRIYEGEKGGSYVDADQEWLKGHAEKGHQPVEEGYFAGLVPQPDHKPNIYEWEDGSHGPKAPSKGVNKAKDEHGNVKIIERNEFPNRGDRAIPFDATEVHISLNPKARLQAKWRNAKTGLIQRSYSKEGAAKNVEDHLEHTRTHATEIQKGIDAIKDASAEDLEEDETLACLALITDLGIRHGTDYTIHEDGFPTGIGAASLKGENVSFSEDGKTATLDFRGKQAHPQNFSTSNEKVVRALKAHVKGKDDFIFGTGPGSQSKKNSAKFKELGGHPKLTVKDIRTNYSTEMAKDSLAKDYTPEYLDNLSEADFKKVREEVGLKVGTALGHWKGISKKGEDGKILRDEEDKPIKELVNHGGMALKSYIDPAVFDEIKPKTDIQNAHTPDWHEKTPLEERDIDEYAEARKRKGENRQWGIREFGGQRKPLVKTWMQSLNEQGFIAPVIKQTNAGQMWFLNNGIDYVGTLGMNGEVFVEKATFKPTFNNPGISYNPAGRNKDVKTREPRKDVETLNFDESDDF